MLNEIERLGKYFVKITLCEIERRRTCILEEFSNDIVEPGGLPNRNVHQPAIGFVFHGIFSKHLHRASQRAKWIPNLMGHPGRHLTQTRQPILAPHLLFKIPNLC